MNERENHLISLSITAMANGITRIREMSQSWINSQKESKERKEAEEKVQKEGLKAPGNLYRSAYELIERFGEHPPKLYFAPWIIQQELELEGKTTDLTVIMYD